MSKLNIEDETPTNYLPPDIISNTRPKIEADKIPIDDIKLKRYDKINPNEQLVYYHRTTPPDPVPEYPIALSWVPKSLHFNLLEDPVIGKLRVSNCTRRPIYMQCCGLWGDTARVGASWCSYPRKRFWLPPGLPVLIFVRATPRIVAPIPSANLCLQIDASNLRDSVTGYFMVPITVCFLKYVPPSLGECE